MPLSKIQDIGNQVVPNIGPNRNILINGAMTVAQRYTSKASISSGDFFVVDRFGGYVNAAGTWTVSQSTDVPTGQGFGNSAKFDCTSANGSLGSGSELLFRQRIEGRNLQTLLKGTSSAKKTIVQFWVKSNKTGTYICELFDNDNSGRHIGKAYTISSADTWEHKTITFEGDTTGTFGNDSNTSLTINWWLAAGSGMSDPSGTLQTAWGTRTDANRAVGNVNLADNTANEWYITGVQFEVGETFTEFEHELYAITYEKARRYYQQTSSNVQSVGFNYDMKPMCTYRFPVTMRAAPTVALISGAYPDGNSSANGGFSQKSGFGAIGFTSPTSANFNTGTEYFRFHYQGGSFNSNPSEEGNCLMANIAASMDAEL